MKKISIVIFFTLLFNFCFSQNTITVIYGKQIEEIEKNAKNNHLTNHYVSIQKCLKKISYTLNIIDQKSEFRYNETISDEKNIFEELAKNMANGGGKTYCEKNGLKLVQKEAYGSNFIIKGNLNNFEWKITKETKKINNITCFKAITSIIVESRRGKINTPVTAWFAPSIANNFGPAGYGGLPGLILELKENKITYYATSIDYNNRNKINIKKPIKGKIISPEEFNSVGREMYKKRGM